MPASSPPTEVPLREQRLALLAAGTAVLLWASAFVGIRVAGRAFTAGPLTLMRLLVGSAVLGAVLVVRHAPWPPRRDLPALTVSALLWLAAYNLFLNQAERYIDAGTASMLVNTGPVLIALLSWLLLREGLPRTLVVGCAVAFAGAVVIGIATSQHGLQAGIAAILCLLAAAAYAVGLVAQKPLLARTSGLMVTWAACSIAAVACLPFAPALLSELRSAEGAAIGWLVYLGLFPTAVGFTVWAYALARTPAGRLAATTYLVPPIATGMSWVVLGDIPPGLAFVGGAMCLVGVAITRGARLPRRRVRRVIG